MTGIQDAAPPGNADHAETAEQAQAAQTIQRHYRGYRERRQLAGIGLDASARWTEVCVSLSLAWGSLMLMCHRLYATVSSPTSILTKCACAKPSKPNGAMQRG